MWKRLYYLNQTYGNGSVMDSALTLEIGEFDPNLSSDIVCSL